MSFARKRSWVEIDPQSDFSLANIPFGVFQSANRTPRCASALGKFVIDLQLLQELEYFDELSLPAEVFAQPELNAFVKLGKETTRAVRHRLQDLFDEENGELRDHVGHRDRILKPMSDVQNLFPLAVGDYTDFYSSRQHAFNVGSMFRDPDKALLPNWLRLPVAYHGRSSTLFVGSKPIHRPIGQIKVAEDREPELLATRQLDFELEVAFVSYDGKTSGEPITPQEASEYIFGLVLFNDWSARDIQKWEYVPLGPFLAKNFASSVSPWIVTLDALESFRVEGVEQIPTPLPYLAQTGKQYLDIPLEVEIETRQGNRAVVCRSNYRHLYWSMAQQLAHHTINGCIVRAGDMMASGTISGNDPGSYGSMLELSWGGKNPVQVGNETRTFIEDGDTVIFRGANGNPGSRVGFGEMATSVLPARNH